MNEHRYKILINDTIVAENMDVEAVEAWNTRTPKERGMEK